MEKSPEPASPGACCIGWFNTGHGSESSAVISRTQGGL
jgi:hypothetical protein